MQVMNGAIPTISRRGVAAGVGFGGRTGLLAAVHGDTEFVDDAFMPF